MGGVGWVLGGGSQSDCRKSGYGPASSGARGRGCCRQRQGLRAAPRETDGREGWWSVSSTESPLLSQRSSRAEGPSRRSREVCPPHPPTPYTTGADIPQVPSVCARHCLSHLPIQGLLEPSQHPRRCAAQRSHFSTETAEACRGSVTCSRSQLGRGGGPGGLGGWDLTCHCSLRQLGGAAHREAWAFSVNADKRLSEEGAPGREEGVTFARRVGGWIPVRE